MCFYLVAALFAFFAENRVQMTRTGIRQIVTLAGLVRLSTTNQVAYADIDHIEVMETINRSKILNITTKDRRRIVFHLALFSNTDELIVHLFHQVPFDPNPIRLDIPGTQDIGKRALYLLVASTALLFASLAFDHFCVHAWHVSSENMSRLFYFMIPASILLSYLWIRGEKKAYPLGTSCVVGVVSGILWGSAVLTANHWLTEHAFTPEPIEMIYVRAEYDCQYWRPINQAKLNINHTGNEARVCANWDNGYVKELQVGATYRVMVVKGWLNDIAFPVQAFHQAQLLQAPKTKPIPSASHAQIQATLRH